MGVLSPKRCGNKAPKGRPRHVWKVGTGILNVIRMLQGRAVAAALALSVLDGPLFLIVALLFLVFPDGRLPSSRWLILVASASLLASLTFLGALLRPGRFLFYAQYENPLDPPPNLLTDAWDGIYGLMVGCVVLAALSLVSRWRRADNVQRAQLKWAAAAATLIGIAMVTYGAGAGPSAYSEAGDIAVGTAFTLFPIAIGVAVLRYRLFEIDRIIKEKVANWDFKRIAILDRLILRMGICELLYFREIPPKVSMNEAIELAKLFSTQRSGQFVNGVLDAVVNDMKASGGLPKSGRGLFDGEHEQANLKTRIKKS